jgi:hypothetical protein
VTLFFPSTVLPRSSSKFDISSPFPLDVQLSSAFMTLPGISVDVYIPFSFPRSSPSGVKRC